MEIKKSFLVPLAFAALVGANGCNKSFDCITRHCQHIADVTYLHVIEALGGVENSVTVEEAQAKSRSAQSRCLLDYDIDPEF
ncbi:MAG: hypothetical protein US89_C0004G0119 [Candidatus Peregrinibacteria bacterium GW2011_GWF2_38_29]|nr:MAG: hypothetical protein US89_C0004G0119 [Candidatus Peregrinibacteria bacterium GW2011_GWF2_38_29]HBB02380.1 hypothetical protein [Candidatus Peregrinibacteria bacterium]